MSQPIVSIILVALNSALHVPRCFVNLSMRSYQYFEVIIIDNGSTDDGYLGLKEKYPELNLSVTSLNQNLGFAVANNIGACLAREE